MLIKAGADVNIVSESGETALTEALNKEKKDLVEILIKKGAKIFNQNMKYRDNSAFYQAINGEKKWALEMFCDHGINLECKSEQGFTPLIYAAIKGFDEMCMYLSLRTRNIDQEDNSGKNIFVMYMLKEDYNFSDKLIKCKQLLMRGSNVNHCNSKGLTPLHFAIENKLPEKMIKFLISAGANPHYEDFSKRDCCDKAQELDLYENIQILHSGRCK